MPEEQSKTTNRSASTEANESGELASESVVPQQETTAEDCSSDQEKNKAFVAKLLSAAPPLKQSTNCKCMAKKGKFYCYKLQQGGWVQSSSVGYPSKQTCEESNCR